MNKKIDLRIIKTKKNLYDSLLYLMKEKSFEDIKVSDICEKALVNRSTFYAHFSDKYELLSSLLSDLKNSLIFELNKNESIDIKDYYMKMIELFLNHIDDNINVYQAIIKNNQNSILMDMIYDTIESDVKSKLKTDNISDIPIDFISKFYMGAIINVGIDYLRNPKKNKKKEVIKYLNQLLPNKIY